MDGAGGSRADARRHPGGVAIALHGDAGQCLLDRTTRSQALTGEGQRFLENTRPAPAALDRALHQARESKDEIVGPLRIVGPKSSFAQILMPLLDEFCRLHPEVQPDVPLDDGLGNWVLDRVDVGFRIGTSPDEGVIARRLFAVQPVVCASPDHLARHGVPKTLDDLSAHRCSVFRHPATGQVSPWYLSVNGEVEQRHVPPAFSTDDTELELQAVLAGHVIGQLANFAAAVHLRAGRLVPLLIPHISDRIGVHVYCGSRAAQPRRVRAFIDLAVQRRQEQPVHVMTTRELAQAAQSWRARSRRRLAAPWPMAWWPCGFARERR